MSELIKISELSSQYGVSTRTLRYYEEIGLIQSHRTDEYAYRMYDEQAKNRLEQILILRKLNISIKDVKYIFSTDSSKAVLDVLSKKAQNIDDEISLLYELRQIVLSFIRQIEKSDFTKQEDVNQLYRRASEIEKAFSDSDYQGISAQTLDIDTIAMKTRRMMNVRVIELPTKPIALFWDFEKIPEDLQKHNDTFYPSKFSRFNAPVRDFENFVLLPDNYSINSSLRIGELASGLYAVGLMQGDGKWGMMSDIGSLYKWINENGFVFREEVEIFRNDLPSQGIYPPVTEMYFPVSLDNERKSIIIADNADNILSNIKIKSSHKIDLSTMVCEGTTVSNFKNEELIICEHSHDGYMHTKDKYNFPIMVKLRASTDSVNLRLGYDKADFVFNWEVAINYPFGTDINGNDIYVTGLYLPARTFADIVWILDRTHMAIIVDGEVKFHRTDMNTEGTEGLSGYVRIAAAWGSIVTVSELEIFELN